MCVIFKYFTVHNCLFLREAENIQSWNGVGVEEPQDVPDAGPKVIKAAPKQNLVYRTTKQVAIDEVKCIAFEGPIMQLVELAVGRECKQCKEPVTFIPTMYGTCLMVKWGCSYSKLHSSGQWASQPNLFGMKAGNLLVPVCHILSGNSYVKTALFAKFLKLGFVGHANYYRYEPGCKNKITY